MTITTTTTTTPGSFSFGISSEEKLSLPLDALIRQTKQQQVTTKKAYTAGKKNKNGIKKKQRADAAQQKSHKQQNVKKTVFVPVSKAARAKASAALASAKRQTVINKRRTGLVLTGIKGKKAVPTVQLRPHKTSAMARKLQKQQPPQGKGKGKSATRGGGLDVSNILNHFRSHPKKFDVPKGSNLCITINLNNVKPVVGGHK